MNVARVRANARCGLTNLRLSRRESESKHDTAHGSKEVAQARRVPGNNVEQEVSGKGILIIRLTSLYEMVIPGWNLDNNVVNPSGFGGNCAQVKCTRSDTATNMLAK